MAATVEPLEFVNCLSSYWPQLAFRRLRYNEERCSRLLPIIDEHRTITGERCTGFGMVIEGNSNGTKLVNEERC